MLNKFRAIFVIACLFLSALAFAGTWPSPQVVKQGQVSATTNLEAWAGTSYTSQASGTCNAGEQHRYYNAVTLGSGPLARKNVTVYTQVCN